MIGDSTVGKTSLINRIRNGIFQSDPCPTIGIDFQVNILKNFPILKLSLIQIHSIDSTS